MSKYAADLNAVRAAAKCIEGFAHRTSVSTCTTLDHLAGRQLYFKCENFQKVGAFKFRGACNAVRRLPDEVTAQGVVTHSSGNHAQALALAAKLRGISAHIVMPTNCRPVKRKAVESYGGHVIFCDPTLEARQAKATAVQDETGATLIPPYDHPDVIAGQGTAALEFLDQVPELDAIVAPIGGGGLVSGSCVAAHGLKPGIQIFAAEPQGADDAARSVAAGKLIPKTSPNTIADGLLTSLGDLTWPIIRDHVESVITVSEQQIIGAMRLMWERAKLLIEPSSAVAMAAVLTEQFKVKRGLDRVGIVLSGGNVDLDHLPWSARSRKDER